MLRLNRAVADATRGPALVSRAATAHAGRLVRFALVGASGVLVNNGLLLLLVEVCGLHRLAAALLATEMAILGNFALNDGWTFRDRRAGSRSPGDLARRAGRYNLVAAGGLLLSLVVIAALTGWCGFHYLAANLIAIALATLWNYAVNARFTWAPSATARPERALAARRRIATTDPNGG